MTLHIRFNNMSCDNCGLTYVPYKEVFYCPKCNIKSEEYFDLIGHIVSAMKINLIEQGSIVPSAWYQRNFLDYVLGIVFSSFEGVEKQELTEKEELDCIIKSINEIEWDEASMKNYFENLLIEVHSEYIQNNKFRDIHPLNKRWSLFFKKLFNKLLPNIFNR